MVPWADGTLLVGATVEEAGFAEDVTVAGIRTLLDAACELVPQTTSAAFREGRVGLRPGTPDTLPILGPSADVPGLFYATGHYRNGILLAPLTATLMADGILEGRWHPLLDAVSPARFHTRGVLRANA
jgi:glycine/D-amino acid oxidase-like deaminating enzyme